MNIYENVVILNASLPDEEINSSVSKITDIIINAGGEVIAAEMWGRRKLSYEIQKQNKGFYAMLIFKAPPPTVKKLEDFYKVLDSVIKYMVIKLDPKQVKHLEKPQTSEAEAAPPQTSETEPAPPQTGEAEPAPMEA
ncbi:MAG: 30S ribosomal protein S6 [Nitrospira bacterium HGW-Nitrospira-1]|nr:MAG: 30S ribosomal protein S6 [Nitrospira bacterium HGW-Nitrospira-1]